MSRPRDDCNEVNYIKDATVDKTYDCTNDELYVRPLGCREMLVTKFEKHGQYTCCYTLDISSMKPIDLITMTKAMEFLEMNYPILRLRIVGKDTQHFMFRESDEVDFECTEGKDWVEQHESCMPVPFNHETGPMWRCRLLPGGTIVDDGETIKHRYHLLFSVDHVISDGASNVLFCNRLLEIIDTLLDGSPVDPSVLCEIPPSLEELLPMRDCAWSEMLPLLKEQLVPASSVQGDAAGIEKPMARVIPLDPLDEEFVQSLLQRCKQEGTTVHGALTAALNQAVYAEVCSRNGGLEPTTLNLVTDHPVNLRQHAKSDRTGVIGVIFYTSSMPFTVSKFDNADAFWEHARQAKATIRERTNVDEVVKKLLLVQLFDVNEHIRKQKEKPFVTTDYIISNMLDITKTLPGVYKNITLGYICRTANAPLYGTSYIIMACTLRGKMFISVTWNTPYTTKVYAQTFAENFIRHLKFSVQ